MLLGVDDNINFQEVPTEAVRRGLSRPTYEDAFLFGEQHPDEQRKGPIVFLHDPEYLWCGYSFNLILGINCGSRTISFISSGSSWHSGYRFAFVDKRITATKI